jgi:hypothetical protein
MRGDIFRLRTVRQCDRGDVTASATELPDRPNSCFLNKSIPLFFIARDKFGFWIAREAEGRIGGIFLLRRSALSFAKRKSKPHGCATMFLIERFELDIENRGNRLLAALRGRRLQPAALTSGAAQRAAQFFPH